VPSHAGRASSNAILRRPLPPAPLPLTRRAGALPGRRGTFIFLFAIGVALNSLS